MRMGTTSLQSASNPAQCLGMQQSAPSCVQSKPLSSALAGIKAVSRAPALEQALLLSTYASPS